MISKITNSLTEFFATADGEVVLHKYEQMMKDEGFQIHKTFLVQIANGLLQYMVTQKFTYLDSKQKDVEQRAIFMCKELIDFLLDPGKGLRRFNLIAAYNRKMARTATGGSSKKNRE